LSLFDNTGDTECPKHQRVNSPYQVRLNASNILSSVLNSALDTLNLLLVVCEINNSHKI